MQITIPLTIDVDADAYARHHGLTGAQAVREHLRMRARATVHRMDAAIAEARLQLPNRTGHCPGN